MNTAKLFELYKASDTDDLISFVKTDLAKEYIDHLIDFDGSLDNDESEDLRIYADRWADDTTPIYTTDVLDFYRENIGFIYLIEDAQNEIGATGFGSLISGIFLLRQEVAYDVNNLINQAK